MTQLKRVIVLKERIDALTAQLNALVSDTTAAAPAAAPRKRRMSAAGRAAISRAATARWAKLRDVKGGKAPAIKTRKISAEGRRRIAEAQKARWAKIKAQKAA